jgi:gamma-glutamyltranspeptidase/glutathione hydrolase
MLERGGNAVDAAVAVAYALAVTHPSAGNIGGGGFMLVRPRRGPTVAIDFREAAPLALTRAKFRAMIQARAIGPAAAGVPGTVAGLSLAHSKFGSLPLPLVIAPAIRLAESHTLAAHQARLVAASFRVLRNDPTLLRIFGKNGKPRAAGARISQPELMHALQRISSSGAAGFYTGPTALALSNMSQGLITQRDLDAYKAVIREPLRFKYRDFDIEVMPPPSAGGVVITQILLMLEKLGASALPANSPEEVHLFIEAAKRAQAERRFGVIDPDAWTKAEYEAKQTRWLDPDTWLRAVPIDREHATPASAIHPLYGAALNELEHTTHFSVVDAQGMVVSCTTTLSASFGARVTAPGTGIILNNSAASFSSMGENQPVAGRRTTSSMAPTLVLKNGETVLVLGTPGGDTIPNTIVQVLRNLIDHDMPLDDAIDAPRLHHGFVPDVVRYEAKRPPPKALIAALKSRGHVVQSGRFTIGDANNVLIDNQGAWAYADPREFGSALAAKPLPQPNQQLR